MLLSRRRTRVGIAIVGSCAIGYLLLPIVVESRVRGALVTRGFPDARVDVASIGLGHVGLRNLHLQDGADIGALDIGSGISLLWHHIGTITVRDAQVSATALDDIAHKLHGGSGGLAFDRVDVTDSTLTVGTTSTKVSGTAKPRGNALDVTLTVKDPTAGGWSIAGKGRVVLGKQVELHDAHVELDVPHRDLGFATVDKTSLSVDASGNLSTLDLQARGVAHGNMASHGVAVSGATLPFTFDREGFHVGAGHAMSVGGEVTIDPFVVGDGPVDVVIHARGLRLAELVKQVNQTQRVSATGLVDGSVAFHRDDSGWSVVSAALRARPGGVLQITDRAWREKLAKLETPLALHAAIAGALMDFQFTELAAELGPHGADPELRVNARGRGRRNHQELDIAVGVRGVRDVAPRLLGEGP